MESTIDTSNSQASRSVALIGNPNSGKTSLFNALTGLHQKIGNFPGVTVDKKSGVFSIEDRATKQSTRFDIVDLPGTYSIYPKSPDEAVVANILANPNAPLFPDQILVIADASNLKRSLMLCTQVIDLGLPTVLVLNMLDAAEKKGIQINVDILSAKLGVPVVSINAREHKGLAKLKSTLLHTNRQPLKKHHTTSTPITSSYMDNPQLGYHNEYHYKFALTRKANKKLPLQLDSLPALDNDTAEQLPQLQVAESIERYAGIDKILSEVVTVKSIKPSLYSEKLDKILVHKVWGYVIFLVLLMLIFQSIFTWAQLPMEWIDMGLSHLSIWLSNSLPHHLLSDLLVDGVLAGLGGVIIFIPQIALLFGFIAILEDTGYMSRVSFIMDRLMRHVGMGGRSVIPMVGGLACAVPAIMSTRTIADWRERLITIMVVPLTTCSARLPVYTLIISLVIPEDEHIGIFNMQGIVFLGLYLLGFVMTILASAVLHFVIKNKGKSFFVMELPDYRMPRWSNILYTMWEKVKVFVVDAGKIIVAVSILLWFLASFGPDGRTSDNTMTDLPQEQTHKTSLEDSYAGMLGKQIEPIIEPLGFDWKIGIALVTSFAAREIFVGTMATLYSVDDDQNILSLREKMKAARHTITGKPTYSLATGISLMIFYAFAMQCMSTIAVVYRETKSWKWPLTQFIYMTALAYLASYVAYSIVS